MPNSKLITAINGESDRVLVLIQLDGGNDGLSTVIPLDQLDNIAVARPNLYIPENKIIKINEEIGFHPEMLGMQQLYDDALLQIIQGVSYPNQNRSHFRSTDIWNTGSAANEYLDRGWIGRYFDSNVVDFPNSFPNNNCPDPFALTIGQSASETCQGSSGNYSMVILDPEDISTLPTPINNDLTNGCYSSHLDFISQSIVQSNAYGDVIKTANESGHNSSALYNLESELAVKLKTVARLISGGLQTKIYIVSLGGFDTHADQVIEGDTSVGQHASLLEELSQGINAFLNDLKNLDLADRVIGMTYSEFGRRILSNSSLGTDHGTAAPLFVFGQCVIPGIIGDNPVIQENVSASEGVPMQYDFRSIYGSILMDWFSATEADVLELFSNDFQYLPIIQSCVSNNNEINKENPLELQVAPNPYSQYFNAQINVKGGNIKLSLFDVLGAEVKVILNRLVEKGLHQFNIDSSDLAPGPYFLRLQSKSQQKTIRVVKV